MRQCSRAGVWEVGVVSKLVSVMVRWDRDLEEVGE